MSAIMEIWLSSAIPLYFKENPQFNGYTVLNGAQFASDLPLTPIFTGTPKRDFYHFLFINRKTDETGLGYLPI